MHFGADPDAAQRFVTVLLGWLLNTWTTPDGSEPWPTSARAATPTTPGGAVQYPSAAWLIISVRA
ncbi:hypothetical protein [Kitasatospora aureofaciens]|uniref:hypothetical protein n=1 Tax=Kitasatospora aureofaciens TaxID=1894 RepID=UPI0036F49789